MFSYYIRRLISDISCFNVFALRETALFWLSRLQKTRKHDQQKARTWNISTRGHENFTDVIFVSSPVKISLFRLHFSCCRVFAPGKIPKSGMFSLSSFGQSNKNTKWHESATIITHSFTNCFPANGPDIAFKIYFSHAFIPF